MFQKYGAQYKFHIISFAIAQACFESGYGTSYAAQHYNNILGIGPHKHYSSWDACVKGYYTDTVLGGMKSARDATTLDAYYSAFLSSGYCADPDRSYYNSIKSIISANNLTKYDAKAGRSLSGTTSSTTASTNNKIAWDYLVGQKGWSKTAAAACIGCWLAENGYTYGAVYSHAKPPYASGTKNPYKYLTKELYPGEIEEYWSSRFPGADVIMKNIPQSLKNYTYNYRPNGVYYSDGYCGIGMGSWTFIYGAGALLQYAKKNNKSWDDLLLQLEFATYYYSSSQVEAIDGKTYGLGGDRPNIYAKRTTEFASVAAATRWFIYYEMPAWYYSGYAPASYISEAEKVYKEFKDSEIGSVFGYTSSSGDGGIVSDPNDVINAEAINALIISIDPSVKPKDINYDELTSNHVSGVMFKAGAFYDTDHKMYTYARNTNLREQVLSAVKAGVRFGLFFDVRARTVDEAKLECEQLYYTVSKYPPALGLWLHLQFSKTSKTQNNKIMDYYVKTMNSWGLSFGSGIYCTKEELDKIDWDKYQENFYLWYVNRFTSESDLDQLQKVLSPEFFVI